ncbi:MAG: hypothetical protein AAB467_03595, partial [Patescibacteria group bacterium]
EKKRIVEKVQRILRVLDVQCPGKDYREKSFQTSTLLIEDRYDGIVVGIWNSIGDVFVLTIKSGNQVVFAYRCTEKGELETYIPGKWEDELDRLNAQAEGVENKERVKKKKEEKEKKDQDEKELKARFGL